MQTYQSFCTAPARNDAFLGKTQTEEKELVFARLGGGGLTERNRKTPHSHSFIITRRDKYTFGTKKRRMQRAENHPSRRLLRGAPRPASSDPSRRWPAGERTAALSQGTILTRRARGRDSDPDGRRGKTKTDFAPHFQNGSERTAMGGVALGRGGTGNTVQMKRESSTSKPIGADVPGERLEIHCCPTRRGAPAPAQQMPGAPPPKVNRCVGRKKPRAQESRWLLALAEQSPRKPLPPGRRCVSAQS